MVLAIIIIITLVCYISENSTRHSYSLPRKVTLTITFTAGVGGGAVWRFAAETSVSWRTSAAVTGDQVSASAAIKTRL